jgi:hypothetical protein
VDLARSSDNLCPLKVAGWHVKFATVWTSKKSWKEMVDSYCLMLFLYYLY